MMATIFNHIIKNILTAGMAAKGVMLLFFFTFLTGCGSDDGVVEYDRNFTQVTYTVKPAYDMQQLYTVKAIYTDFKGIQHEEVIVNAAEWVYKEKESGDHPLYLQVVATAKKPEEYGTLAKELYSLTWEYSIHWHKQEGGAHSIQPDAQGRSVKRSEVESYLAENPTIVLVNFSKP